MSFVVCLHGGLDIRGVERRPDELDGHVFGMIRIINGGNEMIYPIRETLLGHQ